MLIDSVAPEVKVNSEDSQPMDNEDYNGIAYIFDIEGNQLHKITAIDNAEESYFGCSVAISSNRIVVGASDKQNNNDEYVGAVYIYDLDGNGIKTLMASNQTVVGLHVRCSLCRCMCFCRNDYNVGIDNKRFKRLCAQ